MKIVSVFILLIYWSFMISAPVVSKNSIKNQKIDLKIVSNFKLVSGSTATYVKNCCCRESVFLRG